MQIILGSNSPRRKEILGYFKLPFTQASPHFDEEAVPFDGEPNAYVLKLSDGKAESLAQRFPKAIVISADTVVYRNGKIYGKPTSDAEAIRSLSELSGNWHQVITGISIRKGDHHFHGTEETRVLFNDLSEKQIKDYQTRVHWADKAGGYAIQQAGGLIVNKIDGCFYNVMGLPLNTLHRLLLNLSIDLWDHIQ